MDTSRTRLHALVVLILLLLTASLFLEAQKKPSPSPATVAPAAAAPHAPAPRSYAGAAAALRDGDLEQARGLLARVAETEPAEQANARLLEGLYAHAAGETELAEELLATVATPGGALEDWRLLLLGESAAERGDAEVARAAFARLLADVPGSPLRASAYVAAAELVDREGWKDRALELVERARAEELPADAVARLETLAWTIGRDLDDRFVERQAARRLLVTAPATAASLGAADAFREIGGAVDWRRTLTADEVKRRARAFLGPVGQPAAALTTLEGLPEAERDLEWYLLEAQALTRSHRGGEALGLLVGLEAPTPALASHLEWERALAAADLATHGSPAAARRRMLESAHRHLVEVAVPGGDPELARQALAGLCDDFADAGLATAALDALRLLRRLDPADTTGARDLWERGWSAYQERDYTGAARTFRALAEIYPETNDAQRGRYWQARALEEIGEAKQARALYGDMVATSDTDDFYGRQALARFGGRPPARAALAGSTEPWPADPVLRRTKLLIDLGLDDLARREMELLEGEASSRDLTALAALILVRRGERRQGIPLLRAAFPALGGPQQTSVPEDVLFAYYPLDFAATIRGEARARALPGHLVAGIIRQESAFDPRAESPVGARGLMQLMPGTAREVSTRLRVPYDPVRLYEPEVSVRLGTTYFKQVLDRFDGNVELALAGYNGGPNRIDRLWTEAGPDAELDAFVETLWLDESRDYVKRILVLADSYRQLYPDLGS